MEPYCKVLLKWFRLFTTHHGSINELFQLKDEVFLCWNLPLTTLLARLFLLLFTDTLQIKAASNPLMKEISSRIATSETCEYKMWNSFYALYVVRWKFLTSVFVLSCRTVTNTRLAYISRQAFQSNPNYNICECFGFGEAGLILSVLLLKVKSNLVCFITCFCQRWSLCSFTGISKRIICPIYPGGRFVI